MDSPSPVPSTPLNGVSLQGKWTFRSCTPEDCVRKKLFGQQQEEPAAVVVVEEKDSSELSHWSSSSEYFSQSINDASCLSGESQTNLFDDNSPHCQEISESFFTPNPSPAKRPVSRLSMCETPPPLLKRQRLFSPSSPSSPENFLARYRSPARPSPSPRLFLDSSCDSLTALGELEEASKRNNGSSRDVMVLSPPRLERLQLLDYPCTPLSIARSSGIQVAGANGGGGGSNSSCDNIQLKQSRQASKSCSRIKKRVARSGPELTRYKSRGTNINPFTITFEESSPRGEGNKSAREQLLSKSESKPHKKLALRESNISRYREEFHEVGVVGSGSFGTVYKCINRLDGCVYAIKRSHKPVAGSVDEAAALREVCAHAVLGSHPHLVRYYSAWAEDNHMLIQNEFCDGGNLTARIAANRFEGKVFGENELRRLLRHISMGLQYIHSMNLVHLDIKPDNIFIACLRDHPLEALPLGMEAINEDPELIAEEMGKQFVYKIGDMGHVTSVCDPNVEEGDCRYLPREILQENYSQLPKADVFSLGLTVFHAGSGVDLPKNGELWHTIRDGSLPALPAASPAFNKLLQVMVHPIPAERPATSQLLTILCPSTQKSKAQLCKELNEEKFKNEILQRKLEVAHKVTDSGNDKRYLNGPRLNRSMSIT